MNKDSVLIKLLKKHTDIDKEFLILFSKNLRFEEIINLR